jgi:hypothetical protein
VEKQNVSQRVSGYMKGRASKEQMKVLWPTVKQSFVKLVGEAKQANDTNSTLAVRILERHGADVHLPTGDGGDAPTSRTKRDLPNDLESLKDVLRTAGVSVGLAGAFHALINGVKSAAHMKTCVGALGDREAAIQTLMTIGEAGIAVEPLSALVVVQHPVVSVVGFPLVVTVVNHDSLPAAICQFCTCSCLQFFDGPFLKHVLS